MPIYRFQLGAGQPDMRSQVTVVPYARAAVMVSVSNANVVYRNVFTWQAVSYVGYLSVATGAELR